MDCSDNDSEVETLPFQATPPRLQNLQSSDSFITEKKNNHNHKQITNVNSKLFHDNLSEIDTKTDLKRREPNQEIKYQQNEKNLEQKILQVLTLFEEKKQKIQENQKERLKQEIIKQEQIKKRKEQQEKQKQKQDKKREQQEQEQKIKNERKKQQKQEYLILENKKKQSRQQENAKKMQESFKTCKHYSVQKKLLLSFIIGLILTILLEKPKQIQFPITSSTFINNKHVFRIVTDQSTQEIIFPIKKSSSALFLTSQKSANVKAKIKYTVGYEFENRVVSFRKNVGQNISIQMSQLKVLDFSIQNIKLKDKTNSWLWQSWEFQDYDDLKSYIKKNYVPQTKKGIISQISKRERKEHQSKIKNMLKSVIQNSQSFLDKILRRIDNYVDGSLQPFINLIEIDFHKNIAKSIQDKTTKSRKKS